MKKIIGMTIIACMLMSLCAMGISAAEPTILWDFGADEAMNDLMTSATNVQYYGEKDDAGNDYYVFIATSGDQYVTMNTPADDVSQVWWAKIRVKNSSPATAVELFGATNGRGLSGPECTHFEIDSSGEWKTYIIYIPDENVKTANTYKGATLESTYWEGTLESIRLDPMWKEGGDGGGDMTVGDEICIDYVAFFSSEADAKAFRSDLDGAGATTVTAEPTPVADPAPADDTTTAPAADPAPVETTPAPSAVTTAVQTSDAAVIIVAMLVATLGTAIIVSRKSRV